MQFLFGININETERCSSSVLDDSVHNFGFGGIGGIVVSIAAFQAVDPG